MTIQIFGTVCIDKVRKIEEFPKALGTYTTVVEEQTFLGGEASNTFVCLNEWMDKGSEYVRLLSTPIVNDLNGKTIMNKLKQSTDKTSDKNVIYTKIEGNTSSPSSLLSSSSPSSPPSLKCNIEYTPIVDIYVCNTKERTMFGIGFEQIDRYMIECKEIKEKILNVDLQFGPNHWISLDVNYPSINKEIIKKAIVTNTNLFLMDQELDSAVNELSKENTSIEHTSKLIFQSSSDHFGNKNGSIEGFFKIMNQWFQKENGIFKKFLFILTDSKNGFGVGGTWNDSWIEPYWFTPSIIPPDKIIDSTGAGDAFRAGLIFSLIHKNQSLSDSLEFASAVGGLNCLSFGGCSSTPSLNSINQFLKSNNKNQMFL
ncbi:hypothetical protein RB653_003875 [Dictyostelium firmibasis]|uniref:Carbohydrate kinase PfkB domain-containing protein n=1 Tax=Dictyostelium firmibasis TaxID=79012 RepID=A0AAN7YZI4_9MYCE